MSEVWRPVPGLNYEASSLGRVRNLRGRILKLTQRKNGYVQVMLGRGRMFLVHRLVALAFLGLPKEGMEACHGDGNRSNNRVDNIRWDTRPNNALDRRKHGNIRGIALDEDKVREIKKALTRGESQAKLAREHGVSRANISQIATGKIWHHVLL